MKPTILVTGGAGFIGSHTCIELLQADFDVIIVDNFSNSKPEAIEAIERVSGKQVIRFECDIGDIDNMSAILRIMEPNAVIHFAGLKAVGESVKEPLRYYRNNLACTALLLEAMSDAGVKNLVFSSSCTVYGAPTALPLDENSPIDTVNPYGRTKLAIEEMLKDIHAADPEWNISILRYFNPVGAHHSGEIGEDPLGTPTNLMPFLTQLSAGVHNKLSIFGNDYETADGTCIRDYIHVVDVARGHVKALEKLSLYPEPLIHNLGTGKGYSVLEVVKTFEAETGVKIPYEFVGRRAGDAPAVYADASRAMMELEWIPEFDLKTMCADAYRWQIKNPRGYQ